MKSFCKRAGSTAGMGAGRLPVRQIGNFYERGHNRNEKYSS